MCKCLEQATQKMLLIFWQIAGVDFFVERAAGRKTKGLVFVACRHSGTNRWKVYIFSRHLGQCIEKPERVVERG